MSRLPVATDLMKHNFLRLGTEHSLREALAILLDALQRGAGSRLLVVLDPAGGFAGMISARRLLRELAPAAVPPDSPPGSDKRLFDALQPLLEIRVGQAMDTEIPATAPDTPLSELARILLEQDLDCLPVVENGHVVGVVYVTDVFNALARLALEGAPRSAGA